MTTGTYYTVAFAASGDTSVVPVTGTELGTINYTYGYGSNYSASVQSNPSALTVDRLTFNYLLNTITGNWQQLYQSGVVPFITTAMNGGSPYSYALNALCQASDSTVWFNTSAANTLTPGTANSKWSLFNPSWLAHKGMLPLSGITGGTYSFAGLGAGLTLTYTVSGGVINSITSLGGASHTGYAIGDLLTPNAGNYDAVLVVTAVSGTSPLGVGILYGGSGFTAGSGVATQNAFAHFGKISLAGTLTSNATFLVPAGTYLQAARSWIVANNTTGAFTTKFYLTNGSDATTGNGVLIPQGTSNSAPVIIDTDGLTDCWRSDPQPPNGIAANIVTVTANAGTCPVTSKVDTFTNSSVATMAITLATTGALAGQQKQVVVYDFSAVAETIGWTNTENSTVSVPTTSNGSTTLPKVVTFLFNGATSKWRCIASV